ncbi:hypothetical protein ACFVYE_09215 [Streptomyces sp. NPDC058239]|uniref:hypothetical protein n=1 Tax=unclassified Streptomyces TaxID=2593676 RepID=UPI00366200BF
MDLSRAKPLANRVVRPILEIDPPFIDGLNCFADDKRAGDTNGQKVNDSGAEWYVLDTSGSKVTGRVKSGTPRPGPAQPTSGGGN